MWLGSLLLLICVWCCHTNNPNHIPHLRSSVPSSLFEFYERYLVPFGECLTDMERRGVRVDASSYLAGIEVQARKDQKMHSAIFREWAATLIGPDGLAINPSSSQQLQTFLFGGSTNAKTKEPIERCRTFKVLREEVPAEAIEAYRERDEYEKVMAQEAGQSEEETTEDEVSRGRSKGTHNSNANPRTNASLLHSST